MSCPINNVAKATLFMEQDTRRASAILVATASLMAKAVVQRSGNSSCPGRVQPPTIKTDLNRKVRPAQQARTRARFAG